MLEINQLIGFGVGDSVGHKFWRVRMTSSCLGANFYVPELEFRDTAGGVDLCVGGTPLASSSLSPSETALNGFDNNLGTSWVSATKTANVEWLGYSFLAPVDVKQLVWENDSDIFSPTTFNLEYSDNGTDWFLKQSFSGMDWNASSTTVFDVTT